MQSLMKAITAGALCAVVSAETYRPGKVPHSENKREGTPSRPKVFETPRCYGNQYEVIPGGETFSQALVFFKKMNEPAPWGLKWLIDDAEKYTDNIDVFVWSELDKRNFVRVEKWEEAWCHETDFFSREVSKERTFKTYLRTPVAEWKNDANIAEYKWNLNE